MNKDIDFTNAQMLRRLAEEQLKEKQEKTTAIETENDAKKLLHELQVHQIELEMQNEELQKTYIIAETALKKYTMLYDFAPVGYFTLNSEGSICELNFTGAAMLGDRRFSLLNSSFKIYVAEVSKNVFNDFFRRVYLSTGKESCQVMLGNDDTNLCLAYLEGVVIGTDQNFLLSVVDISSLKNQNY